MKINPIQHHKINNINFKSFSIYFCDNVPEPDEFVKSSDSIDIARLKKLNIPNFRLIDSTSVRGATLADKNTNFLKELQQSGIERIVDLRVEGGLETDYARRCLENGLGYFNLPIASQANRNSEKAKIKNLMTKIPEFFEIMDKGKNYMACLLGIHRTDFATALNYLLNPKEPASPPILSHIFVGNEANLTDRYINLVEKVCKKMKICTEIFNARAIKLQMINGIK